MPDTPTFRRRGIVEGFFGPPWSVSHRAAMFEFGAARGMNTYLYAPKDDPYHREHWEQPYPEREWGDLKNLIRLARTHLIDFVYGFHPGKGLHFTAEEPVGWLIGKAESLYREGVRTFAVLFDDIPSHLEFPEDKKNFNGSLARAEGLWIEKILERQPGGWTNVEWWFCPSCYTEDPRLARSFGSFEPGFLETIAEVLPDAVACFWTGPLVVSRSITVSHVRQVAKRVKHRLLLWDNYPVNDLSMSTEMHLGPLTGRDPRLPEEIYGYLNNPLLQETLSFIPLATCFDYAADPLGYDPEASWERVIRERFGNGALAHWRVIREFCEQTGKRRRLTPAKRSALEAAHRYLLENQDQQWFEELRPWIDLLKNRIGLDGDSR